MDEIIFRRAFESEIPRIIEMEKDVFGGEQGIPSDDIDTFMKKEATCWCAESGGKIYAAVAAWHENGSLHWGRFVVFPAARGLHIGTRLAKCSFDDIFSGDTDIIYIDARDATVKIVCKMGGEIVGEPYFFYGSNVTPVVLRKEAYLNNFAL